MALIDCGSQTTIISRSFLHRIAEQLKQDGKPPPELTMPTVRLYGKDGPNGKNRLHVSAQVDLPVKACGKTMSVPMFVQPNSTQDCLLGTNASIPLGFKFEDGDGKPLGCSTDPPLVVESKSECEPKVAQASKLRFLGNALQETSCCLSLRIPNSTPLVQVPLIQC